MIQSEITDLLLIKQNEINHQKYPIPARPESTPPDQICSKVGNLRFGLDPVGYMQADFGLKFTWYK